MIVLLLLVVRHLNLEIIVIQNTKHNIQIKVEHPDPVRAIKGEFFLRSCFVATIHFSDAPKFLVKTHRPSCTLRRSDYFSDALENSPGKVKLTFQMTGRQKRFSTRCFLLVNDRTFCLQNISDIRNNNDQSWKRQLCLHGFTFTMTGAGKSDNYHVFTLSLSR